MTEFADLLKEAAGQPPRPLNMAAVHQRAARLGLGRRAGVWAGAILAVVGIGLPTGIGLAPSGDQPTDVRTVEEHVRPQPDAIADPGTSADNETNEAEDDTQRRAQPNTIVSGTPSTVGTPGSGTTGTTIGGGETADPDEEDRCTRAGPVAADCGEADATSCWAARVGCPATTTTTTTTTAAPPDSPR